MKKTFLSLVLISFLTILSGCAEQQGLDVYNANEVGKQSDISFGKIIAVHRVKIQGENSGAGVLAGAATGGVVGSTMGNGKGSALTTIAGALIGGIAGNAAEKAMKNRIGVEYIIKKEKGKTVSIVQNIGKDEMPLAVGQRVMIQTSGEYQKSSGKNRGEQYQRVLPVEN